MPNRLLTDEEKLRAQLLDESGYVPDPAADPAAASPLSPGELEAPALDELTQPPPAAKQAAPAAPAPAAAAEPDRDAKLAAAIAALGHQPERSPEDRKHAVTNRLIENLYLASVRKPLNFAPYEEDKAKNSDPLLGLKAQLLQARIAKTGQAPAAAVKTPKEQADLTAIKQAIISSRPDLVKAFGGGDENLGRERIMALNDLNELKSGAGIFNQSLTNENADLSRKLAEKGQTAVQNRWTAEERNKLGQVSKTGAGLIASMKTIERLAPGIMHGKVPENFSLDAPQQMLNEIAQYTKGATKRVMDPKAVALASAVNDFADQIMRDRTGAVINADEAKQYKSILNTAAFAGPEALAAVLPMFREAIGRKLAAQQLSYHDSDPEYFDRFTKITGASFKDPIFSDLFSELLGNAPAAASTGDSGSPPPVQVQEQVNEPDEAQLRDLDNTDPATQPKYIRVPPPAAAKPPAGAKVPMINRKTGERVRVLLQDVKDAIADGFEELTGG